MVRDTVKVRKATLYEVYFIYYKIISFRIRGFVNFIELWNLFLYSFMEKVLVYNAGL